MDLNLDLADRGMMAVTAKNLRDNLMLVSFDIDLEDAEVAYAQLLHGVSDGNHFFLFVRHPADFVGPELGIGDVDEPEPIFLSWIEGIHLTTTGQCGT